MRVLSVDLGTANTVAVLAAHGRAPRVVEVDGSATMPSAVFALDDGRLVVGRDAQRRARLDPARYEPNPKYRIDEGNLLLGDVVVPVADALAAVLRRVAEETARQLGGERPDEVRLTHPARWGPVRRGVLLGAAHRVPGFGGRITLVPEPVAAAAHFASSPGRSLRHGQALAVCDLGAGTFDYAVVSAVGPPGAGYVVLAEGGLPDLGGLDLDQALADHLGGQVSGYHPASWQRLQRPRTAADRRAQRALREDVRAAKEALSRHQQTDVPLPEPFADVRVTRRELEALIRPSLVRSVELLAATVHSAGRAGLTPGALAGVYLVGGSSRIPLIASLVAERLGVPPTSPDQPESAVAFGAHHVPRDAGNATAMRTADLPPQRPAWQPEQPASPGPGPAPPFRPGEPPAQPRSGPARRRRTRRGPVLLAATLAVALVAVGLVAVFALGGRVDSGGSQLPTAQECQQPGDPDAEGFTRCLRQLAGTVPAGRDCSAGAGGASLEQIAGVSVNCRLDAGGPVYQVVYTHADGVVSSQSILDLWAAGTRNTRIEADWAGNGLRGRYVSTVDDGAGLLAFGVQDRPLYGMLVVTGADGLTPGELADYFERHVQPGT